MEIKEKVAERLALSTSLVKDILIDQMASAEINSRVEIALKGYEKIIEADKEIRKINPDQIGLDDKGNKVSESYSKTRYEEKKKKEEEKQKIEKALEKALEKGDFGDLKNLIK